jgi:hypothetical protein
VILTTKTTSVLVTMVSNQSNKNPPVRMIGVRILRLFSVLQLVVESAQSFSLLESIPSCLRRSSSSWPQSLSCQHQQCRPHAQLQTRQWQDPSCSGQGDSRPRRRRSLRCFRGDLIRLCAAASSTSSSSSLVSATDLPDSLEDAAIRAAQGTQREKLVEKLMKAPSQSFLLLILRSKRARGNVVIVTLRHERCFVVIFSSVTTFSIISSSLRCVV